MKRLACGAAKSMQIRQHKKPKIPRVFDFSRFKKHHIALHIGYFGQKYAGLASQKHSPETIERYLLEALKKVCLVEPHIDSLFHQDLNYSRCGRTDAGVSALNQVVALNVRSNSLLNSEATTGKIRNQTELDYPLLLNSVLPKDIFILGWCKTADTFSARFSATSRKYRYFFTRRDLDLVKMREAAKKLKGIHDFRNFCKIDIEATKNFVREIIAIEIKLFSTSPQIYDETYYVEISANAFLYHQVRAMMSVLFLVGSGLEDTHIIEELFDFEKYPGRPGFNFAAAEPLALYDAEYENDQICFQYPMKPLQRVYTSLEEKKKELMNELVMVEAAMEKVSSFSNGKLKRRKCDYDEANKVNESFRYRPLKARKLCADVEYRLQNLKDKKSSNNESDDNNE